MGQSKNTVELGADVGHKASYLSPGSVLNSPSSGFNAGISADLYFSDKWSIKAKVIYDQKGYIDNYHLIFFIDCYNLLAAMLITGYLI